MVDPAEKCGWCDEPSVSRVQIKGGKIPVRANVCVEHEAIFERQDVLSERIIQRRKRSGGRGRGPWRR